MKFWQFYIKTVALASIALSLHGCGGAEMTTPENDTALDLSTNTNTTDTWAEEVQQQAPATELSESPLESAHQVQLGGRVTYDRVAFAKRLHQGLDYDNITAAPARGIVVQLLDARGERIASTHTDGDGHYQFLTPKNTQVQVRVTAQLRGQGSAVWNIQVRDNTAGNALYVMDGALTNSGENAAQTRNIHARSGWAGNAYAGDRSAGPFAILDSLYDAVQLVVGADPNIVLPPLAVYWSVNNIAISGSLSDGHIGTSFFTSRGPSIYLLGAADNDSDEYDRAVIQHEFGHYLEHQVSRTESVGGSHSQHSRLDMRVAFGEAWGNAFAGMASGDPLYRDSLGDKQSRGFTINVETRSSRNPGWFSEASVQSLLYNLFKGTHDGGDSIGLGFKPLLEVLTSNAYVNFDGMASIYPFIAQLKAQQPDRHPAIDSLVTSFDIYGNGWYGEGETNSGGSAMVLPLYHQVVLGETVNVCSDSQFQDSNGVDVRRFVRITLPTTRSYDIRALKTSGLNKSNPQIRIFKQGEQIGSILNGTPDREDAIRYLLAGSYTFEIYEQSNADGIDGNGGLVCFDVTIE